MNRSVTITLFSIAILLIVLFAIFGSGSSKKFNWKENYKEESLQPYGLSIIKKMLSDYYPKGDIKDIKEDLPTDLQIPTIEGEISNYVFIGEAMFLDTADVQRLLDFVAAGNNAFISSKSIPHDLMFHLYYYECVDFDGLDLPWDDYHVYQDTIARMNFHHPDLKDSFDFDYKFIKNNKINSYRWHYIDSPFFCEMESGFTELGSFKNGDGDEHANFAMIRYSDPNDYTTPGGMVYLHTNPIAFTNFQMVDKVGKTYAEKIFSHLDDGKIYWDAYSQIKEAPSRRRNAIQSNSAELTLASETPLKYILENKHLSWAWYTLLGMGILYLMFRSKRKQRLIPVEEINTNTSLEFISTIGALYFNKQNHLKLCKQKMKMFLAYIRDRYGIGTKKVDAKFLSNLSKRSGVPEKELDEVFKYYNNIVNSSVVSDETLKGFNKALEDVYKQCK